jgi:hypothetical protein
MVARTGLLKPIRLTTMALLLLNLAGHIVMLSLALNWAGYLFAWGSAAVVGLLCGGCVAGGVVEYNRHRSYIPVQLYGGLLPRRLSSFIEDWMFGMFVIALVYIPFWCQIIRGYSSFETGAIMLSFTGPFLLFQFFQAWKEQDSGLTLPFVLLRFIFSATAATVAALLTRPELGTSISREIGLIATLGISLSALLRWPRSVVVPSFHGSPIMEWYYSPLLVSIAHCGRSSARFQDSFYIAHFGAPVFTNRFLIELRRIPGVDQAKAIAIFTADPATYKDPEQLPAFKKALATVFYVPLVVAGLTFFIWLAELTLLLRLRKGADFRKHQKEERKIRDASYPFDKGLPAVMHRGNEDHRDRADSELV